MIPKYKLEWKWKVLPNGDKIREYQKGARDHQQKLDRWFPDEKARRYDEGGLRWRVSGVPICPDMSLEMDVIVSIYSTLSPQEWGYGG